MYFFTADEHYGHFNSIKYSKRPFDTVEEMELIVQNFGETLQQQSLGDEAEFQQVGVKEWINRELLDSTLNLYPQMQSVVWSGETVTPLIIYQTFSCSGRFVALVHNQKLRKVVDRYELAIRISKTGLEHQLK